jgi:hypothetical protein
VVVTAGREARGHGPHVEGEGNASRKEGRRRVGARGIKVGEFLEVQVTAADDHDLHAIALAQ